MDNHPIPQDITGFKFKLIGSITVKQFLYLIVPSILSYIVFASPIMHPLIKIPIIAIMVVTGLAITFVPIDGRAMDVMFFNFLKALPSENQYIYRKKGALLFSSDLLPKKTVSNVKRLAEEERERLRKKLFLNQLLSSYSKPEQAEIDFFNKIKSFFDQASLVPTTTFKQAPSPHGPRLEVEEEEAALTKESFKKPHVPPKEIKAENNTTPTQHKIQQEPESPILDAQMYKTIKETLMKEGALPPADKPEQLSTVKIITPALQVASGFPTLPDTPNIILGIVKDPRGKVLPNILVEVLDKNNNPVRAFKTNQLGQFISATPLANGTYKIIFTDPKKQHGFDTIELTLSGEIFSPLEVASMDDRERLRRTLFE